MDLPKFMRWVDHRGKMILYLDHKNLPAEEYEKIAFEKFEWFQDQVNQKTFQENELLLCADMTNTVVNQKAFVTGKRFGAFAPYVKKHAFIGLSKTKQALLKIILIFAFSTVETKGFDSKEDAFDWLVED